jgi:Asp-tRNA(Asn)/Glu-tRNA(Gln) amidotransferase A subunit family amidase
MSTKSGSLMTDLIAKRGEERACRAGLEAIQTRAQEFAPSLKASVYRISTYETRNAACRPLAGLPISLNDLMETVTVPAADQLHVPPGRSQDGLSASAPVLGKNGDDQPTLQTAAWIDTAWG